MRSIQEYVLELEDGAKCLGLLGERQFWKKPDGNVVSLREGWVPEPNDDWPQTFPMTCGPFEEWAETNVGRKVIEGAST